MQVYIRILNNDTGGRGEPTKKIWIETHKRKEIGHNKLILFRVQINDYVFFLYYSRTFYNFVKLTNKVYIIYNEKTSIVPILNYFVIQLSFLQFFFLWKWIWISSRVSFLKHDFLVIIEYAEYTMYIIWNVKIKWLISIYTWKENQNTLYLHCLPFLFLITLRINLEAENQIISW